MANFYSRKGWIPVLILMVLFFGFADVSVSKPAKGSHRTKIKSPPEAAQRDQKATTTEGALYCNSKSAVLMDGLTGQVLYEQDAGMKIPPASFVKVLTLYVAFDAIRAGQLKLDDMAVVSEKAWRIQGSKMFIKVGDRVRVEDLLKGIAIQSGNDACIALAEHLAGSEEVFVSKMNEKAASIGMKDSRFFNAHGMPAEGQVTTAMDMAVLARHYTEDHPEALSLHSTSEFTYNGIKQGNRNTLLNKVAGVDGLKTGHVEESGYHLLATAKRENQRMIAVIMGCVKPSTRAIEAQKLLEYGFKNFITVEALKKGATFGPLKVKRGKVDTVTVAAAEDVRVTVSRGKEKSVLATPQLPPFVVAPVQKGQMLAKIVVQNDGKLIKEATLFSVSAVEKTLIPPWPVLAGIILGVLIIATILFLWVRRPSQKKYGS